jgi:hypothetical protein
MDMLEELCKSAPDFELVDVILRGGEASAKPEHLP